MIKQIVLQEVRNEAQVSKAGRPYTRSSIKVAGEWYNGLGGEITERWQPGMTVQADLYDEPFNGKVYKKFKTVKPADVALSTLQKEVAELKLRVNALEKGHPVRNVEVEIPVDLPFDPKPQDQW